MGLFGRRKKKKEAEKKRLEELRLAKIAEDKKIEDEKIKKTKEAEKKAETKAASAKVAKVKKAEVKEKESKKAILKPKVVKKSESKTSVNVTAKTNGKAGPCGKYELYPEAGLFKYRLKASNGEILVVSYGYVSLKSVKTGIETFIKAVDTNNFEIITDKAGFSHFDLFGARGARVIAVGEFYKTVKLAESAVDSVKKFYLCDKIVKLESIPRNEIREEIFENQKVEEVPKGKYEVSKEGAKAFFVKLVASNGQVLLVSQKYASKQSALNGLESIKKAIANQNFTVSKDKQNRFQYKLYTTNKQLIVSGETYPQRASCLSSVESVIRFSALAKTIAI